MNNIIKLNALINTLYFWYAKQKATTLIKNKERWSGIQKKQLYLLLNYASKHCKYYNILLKGKIITKENAIDVLQDLPLLNKQKIREQGFSIYSNKITSNWPIWGNTGGSTGEPLKFPRFSNHSFWEPIHQCILYNEFGDTSVNDIIVSIGGSRIPEKDRNNNIYYIINKNFPYGKYTFSTLYMSDETLPFYISSLNKIKPSYLRGYPSGVLHIAQYIKEHNCIISYKLKGIYLTSECFSETTRKYISEIFNCPVVGQYGHTEMSVFAIQQINESRYYCLPCYGYTEILDQNGKHVKPGEEGEIVVTGFSQYGLPFIRYQTGDLAVYQETINGVVCIESLQGRTEDCIYNKKNEKIYLTGAIFGGHLHAFNYIAQWQIEQNVFGNISLRIVKTDDYSKNIEEELRYFFESFDVDVCIEYVNNIARSISGKQKFLIQNIK